MKTMRFMNWEVIKNENNTLTVNWYDDDNDPCWGFTEDSPIDCICFVWDKREDGGFHKAVYLASAMIALQLLPTNFQIDDTNAVIDGVWYYGTDCGITSWNLVGDFRPSEFNFSEEGNKLAKIIYKNGKRKFEYFEEDLDAWITGFDGVPLW